MNETKELLKDIVAGLIEFLKETKTGNKESRALKKEIQKLQNIDVNNREEIIREIGIINKVIPNLKVVLPKKYKVEVLNQVKEVEVKKPSWYKPFKLNKDIFDSLLDFLGGLVNRIFKVRVEQDKRNPKDYVVVRLSDGKEFYKSLGGGGYIAHGPPNIQKVKVTNTNDLYIWGSGGITVVKAIHWRVKESKQWLASNLWSAVADGNSIYLHIKTDTAKAAHGNVVIESDGKLEVRLFENPTLSDDGVELEDLSLNRETISAAVTKVYKDPGVTSDGTELEVGILGTPGKFTAAGGDITGGYWLLKPNEDYLVKVTNIAGAAIDIVIQYGWHENVAA